MVGSDRTSSYFLAIRQAISRAIVAFYQKCSGWMNGLRLDVNEQEKREIKDILVKYDRSLIAAGRSGVND